MNYLSVENLSKHYGEKVLFEDISFGLSKGDKVALIAKNGTGKTTLLRILHGSDFADGGSFEISKGLHLSYLAQQPVFNEEISIEELLQTTQSRTLEIISDYEKAVAAQTLNYNQLTQKAVDEAFVG